MKIAELVKALDLNVISGANGLDREFSSAYVSDLLSDVMGKAKSEEVWITLQTHKNIMAIASLKDIAAVILVQGFKPDEDTLEKSNEEEIPILSTPLSTFEIAGKIYTLLNKE